MFALDCESNGTDLYHGARPFFFTICWDDFTQKYWEMEVDPLDRQVKYNIFAIDEIKEIINEVIDKKKSREDVSDCIVGQNLKFDSGMFEHIPQIGIKWPWEMTHDTLIAGHILGSNRNHDLTSLAKTYLGGIGAAMEELEKILGDCVQKCRRKCRRDHKNWMIAEENLVDEDLNFVMPSAKGSQKKSKAGEKDKTWKYDYWLPRTLALHEELKVPKEDCDHEWNEESYICTKCLGSRYHTILRDYSNADSASTMGIWPYMEKELKDNDLWEMYLVMMELPPIFQKMEKRGLVIDYDILYKLEKEFKEESKRLERVCINIAKSKGYNLKVPKGARNKSLDIFIFEGLGLKSEGNKLNKDAMKFWKDTLPPNTKEKLFIDSLTEKRDRDTAVSFMDSYKKFGIQLYNNYHLLHPSNNQTGTDTLRTSQKNVNAQQISKLEKCNLREMIVPAPGRELWSMDAQNIELRIPAYRSGEKELINVFERPKDPPYFGSYHLVVFNLLHPEKFKEFGAECKTLFEASWYQWVKNGNFSLIYGAGKRKVDNTFRVQGAYDKIRYKFPGIARLSDEQIKYANKYGYIETIPDNFLNSKRGYPLWCSRTDDNFILPTVPLNYYVQGTACYWIRIWMIECEKQLIEWRKQGFDGHMILNVHDELVFDFPFSQEKGNLWRIKELNKLGQKCGERISVPIVIGVEYHQNSWAVGEKVKD